MAICLLSFRAMSQQEISMNDTSKVLAEIVVQAYQANRPILEVPASLGVVNTADLARFNTASLLPVINTIPGVRMEERSPGSYRLSMRGSSLRSPFGVRNVKVYWNGLPFTDAGGNTYLNLFDFSSIQRAEIIKGPGSSLYGAGTGGVLLLKNNVAAANALKAALSFGSFGLMRFQTAAQWRTKISSTTISYAHQQAAGYREHTDMNRNLVQAQSDFYLNSKNTIALNLLFSDLYYQTPGGLTRQQFEANPQLARPGATTQKAAVYNHTFFGGLTHEYEWSNRWLTQTGIYGSFTDFSNPTIRVGSYEVRNENGFGGRTNTSYSFSNGKLSFGAELQQEFSPIKNYQNLAGEKGNLLTHDELSILTYFAFSQVELFLPWNISITAGASVNKLNVDFIRLSESPQVEESRNFDAILSPRLALLKKINDGLSVFASYSSGYSTPTIQELYPATNMFDQQLNPERGNNLEAGMHGKFFRKTLQTDFTIYDFRLKDAIVLRRTPQDEDYYINAGGTIQRGAELYLGWTPTFSSSTHIKLWSSYTFNAYTFDEYVVGDQDHSGNDLTGTPQNILVTGIDLEVSKRLYANFTYTYTDRIPLNDDNTVYADAYHLLGGKVGCRNVFAHYILDFFLGVDNALNQTYSLGNDLNAAGERYYNAAPTANFYAGINVTIGPRTKLPIAPGK